MANTETATTRADPAPGPVVYDGFISYSHAADDLLAPRLQAGLQRFAKPWWKRRALRMFRDKASLSANPHLWSSITEAMDRSSWFVLLLSEDAAASEWVDREVAWWLEHKDASHIIPVVTDGAFGWADADISPDSTAVPPSLFGAYAEEPRWVDLRFARSETQLDLRHAAFRSVVADIASAMRGVPKDELESEEIRQHRRTIRTASMAGVALIALTAVAVAAALFAFDQRAEAQRQAQLSRARELAAAALANLSVDPERSVLLAVAAVEAAEGVEGAVITEPFTALRQSLASSRVVLRVPGNVFVEYSPDGSLLATGDLPDAAIWDANSGERIHTLPSEDGRQVKRAAFSPDGRLLAVGYQPLGDGPPGPLVVLWDVITGEAVGRFDDPDLSRSYVVAFSADGALLAAQTSGAAAAPVVVWDVATGTERYRIEKVYVDDAGAEHIGSYAAAIAFSRDGLLAVTGGFGPEPPSLYDGATGEWIADLDPPAGDLSSVNFDPTGRYLAAVSQGAPVVVVWNVANRELETSWEFEALAPEQVEWSPSGQYVAVGGREGIVRLFDVDTGVEKLTLLGSDAVVFSVAYSPNGDRVAAAASSGSGDTLVWDVSPSPRRDLAEIETPYPGLGSIAYSEDGESILVLSDAGTLARIDVDAGAVVASVPGLFVSGPPFSSLLFPEAGLVAAIRPDWTTDLLDAETFEVVHSLPNGPWEVVQAVSPDRTLMLLNRSADTGESPMVAEVASWDEVLTLEIGAIYYADFSPDGTLLSGLNGSGAGWVIDLTTGSTLASFHVLSADVEVNDYPGWFSPDGSFVTVTDTDSHLRLLDVLALRAGATKEQALSTWEITDVGEVAFFSPDASLIGSVGSDSHLRVWNTTTGELVADFGAFGGIAPAASFHPDGAHLIVEDAGGTIQVVTLDSRELIEIAVSRLTRGFTGDECVAYRIDPCPTLEDIRTGSA